MNRTFKLVALVLTASASLHAQERFANPRLGFGFSAGGAQGANSQSDKWVLHYGGFVQFNIWNGALLGQTGAHYNKLMANDYWAKIAYADQRFLFVPYSTEYFNPFVEVGLGLAKPVYRTGTKFIGIVPLGAGVQTKLSPSTVMQFELFYVYALSDSLDGRPRSASNLNPLTNGGQDSFYGARVGLILGTPSRNAASSRARSDHAAQEEMMKENQRSKRLYPIGGGSNADAKSVIENASTLPDSEIVSPGDSHALYIDDQALNWSNATLDWTALTNEQKSETVKRNASRWKKVGFAFRQRYISLEAQAVLREILAELQSDLTLNLYVIGYSDNLGDPKANQALSLHRATLVKKWLVDHGVADGRLKTLGKGSDDPIADNDTDAGRSINRRVEFWRE